MEKFTFDELYRLLGTSNISGTRDELCVLRIRMGELAHLNGEEWVRENSSCLLAQWGRVLELGVLGHGAGRRNEERQRAEQ